MKFKSITQILEKYKNGDEFYLAQFNATALDVKPQKIKPIKVKLVINDRVWSDDVYFETEYGLTRKSPYSEFCGNEKFIIGDSLEKVLLKYNAVKNKWIQKRTSYLKRTMNNQIDCLVSRFADTHLNNIEIVATTVEEQINIEKFKKQLYNNIVC